VSFAIATALFSQAYLRQHPTGEFIRIIKKHKCLREENSTGSFGGWPRGLLV
jgi:hypothetical protein